MGLLGDYLPGLPDDPNQNSAARQGLLAFGAAMLGGRGNFGQILGQGLASGAGGYNSALQALQQKAFVDAQTKHYTLQNDAAEAEVAQNKDIAERLSGPVAAGAPTLPGGGAAPVALVTGGAAPLSNLPQMSPAADRPLSMVPQASAAPAAPVSALPQVGAGTSAAPTQAQNADRYEQFMAMGDSIRKYPAKAKIYYDMAEKLKPEVLKTEDLIDRATGEPVHVMTFKDGSTKVAPFGSMPDYQVVNNGKTNDLIDKRTGKKGASYAISVSPDSEYSRQTQYGVQGMINARQEAADRGEPDAKLEGDELRMMGEQYLAGDKSVLQNLGRGKQGAENIVALRREITRQAKVMGLSGADLAAATADFEGLKAGLRTSANISARVENAISEAKELAPLAIEAGKKVSRSGVLAFGKAQVMFDTQTNDPDLKAFATANNGLVSAYAGAMARGQKPTVSDYDHAREILSAAQSQQAYEATVNQMYKEMAAASRAPQNVREHLRGEIGGKGKSAVKDVKDLPKNPPAPVAFSDAEKERRYQEWKRSHSK